MQVLIVDNSVLITERIEDILLCDTAIAITHKANNYQDALMLIHNNNPSIIIVNSLLKNNGVQYILNTISSIASNTKVIMLLNNEDDFEVKKMKSAGVHFFLDKYNEFEKIPSLINSIYSK